MLEPFVSRMRRVHAIRVSKEDNFVISRHGANWTLPDLMPDGRTIYIKPTLEDGIKKTRLHGKRFYWGLILVIEDLSADKIYAQPYTDAAFNAEFEADNNENWQIDGFEDDDSSGIEWAIVHAKEGRRVRRESWASGFSVTLRESKIGDTIIPKKFMLENENQDPVTWSPSQEDLLATDWQVIFNTIEEQPNDSDRYLS